MIDGYKNNAPPNSQLLIGKRLRPELYSEDFGPNFDPRTSYGMGRSMGNALVRKTNVEKIINYYKCTGEN